MIFEKKYVVHSGTSWNRKISKLSSTTFFFNWFFKLRMLHWSVWKLSNENFNSQLLKHKFMYMKLVSISVSVIQPLIWIHWAYLFGKSVNIANLFGANLTFSARSWAAYAFALYVIHAATENHHLATPITFVWGTLSFVSSLLLIFSLVFTQRFAAASKQMHNYQISFISCQSCYRCFTTVFWMRKSFLRLFCDDAVDVVWRWRWRWNKNINK